MTADTARATNRSWLVSLRYAVAAMVIYAMALPFAAAGRAEVSGVLIANGVEVELPFVYVWTEKEGFYDTADPTWEILFVGRELKQQEIGEPVWDAAWVEIGVTRTSEFGDKPELQVYSQAVKLAADSGGNLTGGTHPQIEIEGLGSDRISGRIYHNETQDFFGKTFTYDFTFTAALSDPDAPIGEVLPAGGGEPGRAYLKWVEAVHSGDLDALKAIVPPEMAEQIDSSSAEEAKEQIAFMQEMTPVDVRITGGSTDGETAILEIEGKIAGEAVTGEIVMTRMGEFWVPTESKM